MSVWFLSSRPTVASVSGEPVVRLMIASRVQTMWSSQSLRMSVAQRELLAGDVLRVRDGRRVASCGCVAVRVGVVAVRDGERGEGAEEGDERRQRERDRAGGPGRVHVSVPFGRGRVIATGRRSRLVAASEADGLDRLGRERETVDRLRVAGAGPAGRS